MSAWKGYTQATIYFPDKYIDEILNLNVSDDTKNMIINTKNAGKSKPYIFKLNNKKYSLTTRFRT